MPSLSKAQSHLRHPLNAALASAGHVRVLRALVAAGQAPQSAPQLAVASGLTPPGTRGVLESLAAQGLLVVHGAGRAQLYALSLRHPTSAALVALFTAEGARWASALVALRAALAAQGSGVVAAWLYGSAARGEDTADSDVDIAAVVESTAVAEALRTALMAVEDVHQVRVSLTALLPAELLAVPVDDRWWQGVVNDARVLQGPAPLQARQRLQEAALPVAA